MARILGPDGQPIRLTTLGDELAAPTLSGIRQVWHGSVANNLTPARLSAILTAANNGDAHDYLTLAEEMEERDMHYASVLGTRKLALLGLDVRVESHSDAADDVRRADAVRELAETAEFGELLAHLVDALGKGFAVAEILWQRSLSRWTPAYAARDPRFFAFDRETGQELRLLDEANPAEGIPLPPYKFIQHRPRIRSGLPIRGGLARLAAPAYMCKAWAWRDWMAFADIYGLPLRVGRYGPAATEADIGKLMAAVANLGSDAAAVMPESVRIEFQQAANAAGAGDFFERLTAFWDKQISKGVLGQTMTADDGASLSQAQVHQIVRLDIMTADARALSNTLQRDLVKPFCDLNFGPGPLPRLALAVPKPENTAALVEALSRLVPLGLAVEQSVIRDKLGLPDPDADSDVLKAPSQPLPTAFNRALNRAEPVPAPAAFPDQTALEQVLDALDAGELNAQSAQLLQPLLDLAQRDPQAALDAIAGAWPDMDDSALQNTLARALFVAEAWGRLNV